ncbi:MAG: DUF3822 family protein [Bacteroidota bacterium]
METLESNFKLVNRVKDTKFNIDHLHHYNLLLQIGARDFQLCVTDPRKNRCLLVEDYKIRLQEGQTLQSILKEIFEGHHILLAGFWSSVKISFKNKKFTLVPSDHFEKSKKNEFLCVNASIDDDEDTDYYKLIRSDAVLIFAYNKAIVEWMKSIYKKARVHVVHQSASFIEGILHHDDHVPGRNMFVLFDSRVLHILVTDNDSLIYYNQFVPSDIKALIKDVLLIMKAMKMNQQTSKVMIWGDVNADSKVFKGLYKYIRHISLGGKPSFLSFSYVFDEISEHKHFALYSLNLCN